MFKSPLSSSSVSCQAVPSSLPPSPAWSCRPTQTAPPPEERDRAGHLAGRVTRACRKLWRRPHDGLDRASISHFVNLWKAEAEREQLVLLADGPRARKAEPLTQPQHGLK